MLHDQDLAKFLWGESFMTIVYIQNRSPHRLIDNMTPKEVFPQNKPTMDHLKIFGCRINIRIPKDKRRKLEPTCLKGMGNCRKNWCNLAYGWVEKAPSQVSFQLEISNNCCLWFLWLLSYFLYKFIGKIGDEKCMSFFVYNLECGTCFKLSCKFDMVIWRF